MRQQEAGFGALTGSYCLHLGDKQLASGLHLVQNPQLPASQDEVLAVRLQEMGQGLWQQAL